MKRLLAVAVATATTATLTLAATPANAAARPGVVKAGEASSAYGVKVTGSVKKINAVKVPTTCTKTGVIKLKKGKSATYTSANGNFTVVSQAFVAKSKASAKKIFKKAKFWTVCASKNTVAGTTSTLTKTRIPKLGTARFAHLLNVKSTNPNVPVQVNGYTYVVRKKNTVVLFQAVGTAKPNAAANIRLLKKAVKRA